MESNPKILLWGWYGFENLGDDLLLETMITHLSQNVTVPMKKNTNWMEYIKLLETIRC